MIFTNPLKVEYDESEYLNELPILKAKTCHPILDNIRNCLNDYLKNNYRYGINFVIIKDIVDREIEVKDEEITQSLSSPLYLGLVGTLIGIIFGLLSLYIEMNLGTKSTFAEADLGGLLQAVSLAVFASVSGLIITIVLSTYNYKKAIQQVLSGKNRQLSYLQTHLLPKLHSIEETGLSGLQLGLEKFTKNATKLSKEIVEAMNQTTDNLEKQINLVSKVEQIDVSKLSKYNIELFDKLDQNVEKFHAFSEYIDSLGKISNNLERFSDRTSNIDSIMEHIEKNFEVTSKLAGFLSSHLSEIEDSKNYAISFIGSAKENFDEFIGDVTKEFKESINAIKEQFLNISNNVEDSAGSFDSHLKDSYNYIKDAVKEMTDEYKKVFEDFLHDSTHVNQFKNLNELLKLDEIVSNTEGISNVLERINSSASQIDTTSNNTYYNVKDISQQLGKVRTVVNATSELNDTLNQLAQKLNNVRGYQRSSLLRFLKENIF